MDILEGSAKAGGKNSWCIRMYILKTLSHFTRFLGPRIGKISTAYKRVKVYTFYTVDGKKSSGKKVKRKIVKRKKRQLTFFPGKKVKWKVSLVCTSLHTNMSFIL